MRPEAGKGIQHYYTKLHKELAVGLKAGRFHNTKLQLIVIHDYVRGLLLLAGSQ